MILDDEVTRVEEREFEKNVPFNKIGAFLIITLGVFAGSVIVGSVLTLLIGMIEGVDLNELLQSSTIENTDSNRYILRMVLLLSHLFQFIIPGILISYISIKALNNDIQYKRVFNYKLLGLSFLLLLFSMPFIQFTQWVNTIIPIDDSLMQMEDSTNAILKVILAMDSPMDLIITIFLVAVIPAIGEEYLFRGLIQPQLHKLTKKPHLAIWITAIAFSAMHMQFNGFLPRMFLGLLLGYIFYWSKNLLIPIAIHFFFNGSQVITQYILKLDLDTIDTEAAAEDMTWYGVLLSVILMGLIIKLIIKERDKEEVIYSEAILRNEMS